MADKSRRRCDRFMMAGAPSGWGARTSMAEKPICDLVSSMSESDGKASTPASGPNPHKLTMGPTVGSKAPLEVCENPRAFAVVIANSSLTGNQVLRSSD